MYHINRELSNYDKKINILSRQISSKRKIFKIFSTLASFQSSTFHHRMTNHPVHHSIIDSL